MQMKKNRFKQAISAGQLQIGLWSSLSDNISVEILAASGFDWLLIDTEHAPNEVPNVVRQLQAAETGTASMVVRPAWNDTVLIKRFLDAGAQTLLIPMVQNAEEARRAVAATRYPSADGLRGFASQSRASAYGRMEGYFERAHEEICVLVQVESLAALENIEEIAAVEGVDGIFIGPGDLSADMKHPGQPGHPDVVAKVDAAIARVKACGKPAGILIGNEALARHFTEEGCVFTAIGSDIGLLINGAKRALEAFDDLKQANAQKTE